MAWDRFVALGDSFTEGLDDRHPGGTGYRGWADLVAGALAAQRQGFGYANLAIRGRMLGRIVAEQVPPALAMGPDLISFAAGINDALRRGFDPAAVGVRFDAALRQLRDSGAEVLVFRFAEATVPVPGWRLIAARVALLNRVVMESAGKHGARLLDLSGDDEFANPALWSTDRLHLAPPGHYRVAAHVLTSLGVEPDPDWWKAPPRPPDPRWPTARTADLTWAGRHLAPWLRRRLTGRSSGDGITAKRPTLTPINLLNDR